MAIIQATLAALILGACVLLAADELQWSPLLRGLVSNLLLWSLLFLGASLVPRGALRLLALGLVALLFSIVAAHVLINGGWPNLDHLGLATDRVFLTALLADRVFLGLLAVNLAWILLSERMRPAVRNRGPRPTLLVVIGLCMAGFLVLTQSDPRMAVHWYAQNPIEHLLAGDDARGLDASGIIDGRSLVPRADGERIVALKPPHHVLLVLVEGLSALDVAAGRAPEIAALEPRGLVVRNFVTHQRQTHRGMFSALCGAYPNLVRPEAKSHLMALSGLRQTCLPRVLGDAGFRTAFLQSAPLGYMSKDLFARAAGFDSIKGLEALRPAPFEGLWGLDDHFLLERALEEIRALRDHKAFVTLLTSGTHAPFSTPESNNDRDQAMGYASRAVRWLVEQLKREGWLDDTLVIITSDESGATTDRDSNAIPAANHGYLLALGSGLENTEQPGLFGLVDIPRSVLDAEDLPSGGFGGASVFRRASPRLLLAANTYRRELYVLSDAGTTRCNQKGDCVGPNRSPVNVQGLEGLVAGNDLSLAASSPRLASMQERSYPSAGNNVILGQLLTNVPPGTLLEVQLEASTSTRDARYFQLESWDCRGGPQSTRVARAPLPAGSDRATIRFPLVQRHAEQCLRLWSVPESEGSRLDSSTNWTLHSMTIGVEQQVVAAIKQIANRHSSTTGRNSVIAHAGGALGQKTYSNSLNALTANYARGFRWFEMDFQWTSDGELVCGDDWGPTFSANFDLELPGAPTRKEFDGLMQEQSAPLCSVEALAEWIGRHPDTRIITDMKERPLQGLVELTRQIPHAGERLIPQAYLPEQVAAIQELGYTDVIWTLYRYAHGIEDVIEALQRITPFAVTMDINRLSNGEGLVVARTGIPVYVHTVNDPDQARAMLERLGATGIYTDVLDPTQLSDLGPSR